MAIKFNCPKCGKKVGVPDTAAGKTGKCPGCGTTLTVPKTAAPPPVRPDKQGVTDYSFRLSDEDRRRIEEEEKFRAEARARAERQVRSKETPPFAMLAPPEAERVVTFDCPYCFREITVATASGSSTTPCPGCRQEVAIPEKSKSAASSGTDRLIQRQMDQARRLRDEEIAEHQSRKARLKQQGCVLWIIGSILVLIFWPIGGLLALIGFIMWIVSLCM